MVICDQWFFDVTIVIDLAFFFSNTVFLKLKKQKNND